MSLDVYKIYKTIYTEGRKYPENITYQKSRQILKNLCMAIHNHHNNESMRDIAYEIRDLELDSNYYHFYSETILNAISDNALIATIPYPVLHRWNESENSEGWIYLAVSDSKKGQVKIGATTMIIDDRLKTYYSKYNYRIKAVWSEKVDMPFKLEKKLQDYFKDYRVAGQTDGDSNEWYFGEVDTFISVAKDYIKGS
jgi:hypothetical protein